MQWLITFFSLYILKINIKNEKVNYYYITFDIKYLVRLKKLQWQLKLQIFLLR